jgi:acyl-CoA thioesterase FadM
MSEVTYRGTVYPWQCDHVGHMNVMWYVSKFDEATWNFFASIGITPSYMRDNARGMAAVQQNISYRREFFPGGIVEIRTRPLELRDKVIRFTKCAMAKPARARRFASSPPRISIAQPARRAHSRRRSASQSWHGLHRMADRTAVARQQGAR